MDTQVCLVKTSSKKTLIFLQVENNTEVRKKVHYPILTVVRPYISCILSPRDGPFCHVFKPISVILQRYYNTEWAFLICRKFTFQVIFSSISF